MVNFKWKFKIIKDNLVIKDITKYVNKSKIKVKVWGVYLND